MVFLHMFRRTSFPKGAAGPNRVLRTCPSMRRCLWPLAAWTCAPATRQKTGGEDGEVLTPLRRFHTAQPECNQSHQRDNPLPWTCQMQSFALRQACDRIIDESGQHRQTARMSGYDVIHSAFCPASAQRILPRHCEILDQGGRSQRQLRSRFVSFMLARHFWRRIAEAGL